MARYGTPQTPSTLRIWRNNNQLSKIPQGKMLRLQLERSASVHWSVDGWQSATDTPTLETGFGLHVVDLDTSTLEAGCAVVFTFLWLDDARWDDAKYTVQVMGK